MPVDIKVSRLARHCDPFRDCPWGIRVTRLDVWKALLERRLVSVPGTMDHAGRIAFLVENPATDAIEVDVGAPELGFHVSWFLLDGNHRFAAALYARRETISASVGGSLAYAKQLFGVDCAEPGATDQIALEALE
jgi:hypothetical protein